MVNMNKNLPKCLWLRWLLLRGHYSLLFNLLIIDLSIQVLSGVETWKLVYLKYLSKSLGFEKSFISSDDRHPYMFRRSYRKFVIRDSKCRKFLFIVLWMIHVCVTVDNLYRFFLKDLSPTNRSLCPISHLIISFHPISSSFSPRDITVESVV